ncbi:MAG: hypothetical protein H0W86_07550 [Armatimonadetes bacterium]|nr:hypothetical protein [Armatimonadota bacterium]
MLGGSSAGNLRARLRELDAEIGASAARRLEDIDSLIDEVAVSLERAALVGRDDLIEELRAHNVQLVSERDRIQTLFAPNDEFLHEDPVAEDPAPAPSPEPLPPPIESPPHEPEPAAPLQASRAKPTAKRESAPFAKSSRGFFAKERKLEGRKPQAELTKALVCEARALIQWAAALDEDDDSLRKSFQLLKEHFCRNWPDVPFFGFNADRAHPKETWLHLAEAYEVLPISIECLNWVEANKSSLHPSELEELIVAAAAPEAYLFRLAFDHGLEFKDKIQRDIHDRIIGVQEDLYIPWWETSARKRNESADIRKAAMGLTSVFERIKARVDKRVAVASRMAALQELAQSVEDQKRPVDDIVAMAADCLAAGVPPSDKKLVVLTLPYRAVLEESGDKRLTKLIEFISKQERVVAKAIAGFEIDQADDPEADRRLDRVKDLLRGKTVLFVGGHCVPEKQRKIKASLELGDLVWPEATPDTNQGAFLNEIKKADYVCYLIRWSRHSYKEVIDKAKAMGKKTIIVKAGVGLNRFVHDVDHQVLQTNGKG